MFACLVLTVAWQQPAPVPFRAGGEVSARLSGKARLTCQTWWHQLDLSLKPAGQLRLGREALKLFQPPPGQLQGKDWEVKGPEVLVLVRALHAVAWGAGQNQPAYDRWKGEMPRDQALRAAGALTLRAVRDGNGHRITFAGRLTATDSGFLANRFGPNWWRDEWTHEVTGALRLDDDGAMVGFELRDQFKVAGIFYTQGTTTEDPNTRAGTLEVSTVPLEPLPPEQARRVRALIDQLAAPAFAIRERATRELHALGPQVAAQLRQLGLGHPDEEVRRRVQAILRKLEE